MEIKSKDNITLGDLYELVLANQTILNELTLKTEMITQLSTKVTNLEAKVETLEKEMKDMQGNVNDREQYARSWSIRINGLDVSKEEEDRLGKDRAVMKKAYDRVLKPILQAAKDEGVIESVPSSYYNLLENGHKLQYFKRPGAKPSKPGPPAVIVRFSSRFMRNTVLRNKRKHTPNPSAAEVVAGSSKYSIYEDLTRMNFQLLKSLIEDTRFSKCWTVDGKIRFILAEDSTNRIHIVTNIHQSLDVIYNTAKSMKK